jgi:hypothetical protein
MATALDQGDRMKTLLLFLVAATLSSATVAFAAGPDFIVCKSTYALCTTAACSPIPGKNDVVSCQCIVENDYSAGLKACEEKKTSQGLKLRSRYHPIDSYARCSNSRPWAWCLDAPCVADKDNPAQASCACKIVSNQGDYVIVNSNGQYDATSCTSGIYSSATVGELDQVTNYLKTHETPLKPVPIKVTKEN